jgi:tetratricopeptide (TPR) repeat protein
MRGILVACRSDNIHRVKIDRKIDRSKTNFARRKKRGSPLAGFLVLAAVLVAGGYLLVQMRLGNSFTLGRRQPTRTPTAQATPTRNADDFLRLAEASENDGDYRKAIEWYDQAGRRRPNDPDLHRRVARLLVFLNDPVRAEQRARKALEINPNHASSKATLCLAIEWQKRIDEAIVECEAAIQLDPKLSIAHAYLAETLADKAATSGGSDIAPALVAAQQAVDLDPKNVDALRNLGYVNDIFGRYDNAIFNYQRALEISPNMPHVLNGLGRVYYTVGRADSAIETFRRVIRIDDKNAEAYEWIGLAQTAIGEFEKARLNLDKAVELDPNRLTALTRRAGLRFGRFDYEGAIQDYTAAISLSQKISETLTVIDYRRLGFAYQKIDDCDSATRSWDKALALSPNDQATIDDVQEGYRRCGR